MFLLESYPWTGSIFQLYPDFMETVSLSPNTLLVLQSRISRSLSVSFKDCRQFVTDSPSIVRMLQVMWLLNIPRSRLRGDPRPSIRLTQLLLDLSWDDLTSDLSALHSLIGGGTHKQLAAATLTMLALSVEVYRNSLPSLTAEIIGGVFRLIQQNGIGHLPLNTWARYLGRWGQLIRHSPRSNLDLLRQLREFVPPCDVFRLSNCDFLNRGEFYHAIEWLKAFPNPPDDMPNVLERWQGYLQRSREICQPYGSEPDHDFEWKVKEMGVTRGTIDEEGVIRRWQCAIEDQSDEKA
ncbi:hypothetical protein DFH06DRAFT_283258 [Mycena polygramma]|nr:hypothetical protein DFH06DRAFT_283258 [Mycena polygramma]